MDGLLGDGVHVPARVYPGAVVEDEDFGDTAGGLIALAALLDFVEIVGVDDGGVAVDLDLGLREFEADEFAAGGGEARRAVEHGVAISPGSAPGLEGNQLFREQLFE